MMMIHEYLAIKLSIVSHPQHWVEKRAIKTKPNSLNGKRVKGCGQKSNR